MMEMIEVAERLRALETKIDALLELAPPLEGRVRKLEDWRSWTAGGIAALSVIVGALWRVLGR